MCAEAGDACGWKSLTGVTTKDTLLQKFGDWVGKDPLAKNRARAASSTLTDRQSYIVRDRMFDCLRDPDTWIKYAKVLQYWYENPDQIRALDDDELKDYAIPQPSTRAKRQIPANDGNYNPATSKDVKTPNALSAISCLDSQYRPPRSPDVTGPNYQDAYRQYSQRSIWGSDMSINNYLNCPPWVTLPKERFNADTNRFAGITTLNPIAFIQTPYDPVTPEASGDAAKRAFTNSFILKSNGTGVS